MTFCHFQLFTSCDPAFCLAIRKIIEHYYWPW